MPILGLVADASVSGVNAIIVGLRGQTRSTDSVATPHRLAGTAVS